MLLAPKPQSPQPLPRRRKRPHHIHIHRPSKLLQTHIRRTRVMLQDAQVQGREGDAYLDGTVLEEGELEGAEETGFVGRVCVELEEGLGS